MALNVADNGVGIPQADLPRVVKRALPGKMAGKLSKRSTGLGLYLCRTLRAAGAGFLHRLAGGGGTRVSIIFPRDVFILLENERS